MAGLSQQSSEALSSARWSDLAEPQPESTLTPVEQRPRTPRQVSFIRDGVLRLPRFFADREMERYRRVREMLPKDHSQRDNFYGGWAHATPYMEHPALRRLALNHRLMRTLEELIGEPMGLHLCLTGWVSTERKFHQDTYLNPPELWSFYLAVWIALDDISPDAGPFQFVPGSHRWEVLRRESLFRYLTPEERESPYWPTWTQDDVSRICEDEIANRDAEITTYLPKRGDVLVWHSNLIHRGSAPSDPTALRRSLICHYSAYQRRRELNPWVRDWRAGGGRYYHAKHK
ncbi:MAG: phytanoyl-CoA dioxygenase family protein [Myxococcota bacterium]